MTPEQLKGIKYALGKLLNEVKDLKERVAVLEAPKAQAPGKKRKATTWPVYEQVMVLYDKGMSITDISKQLDLHYNTVSSYIKWDEATIALKKREWDEGETKRKAVVKKEDKAEPENQEADSGSDSILRVPQDNHDNSNPEAPAGTRGEMVTVQTEVPTLDNKYEWYPWHPEDQKMYDTYPDLAYPTGNDHNAIVVVNRFGNSYSLPYAVTHFDWGYEGGISRWRYATEDELNQYFPEGVSK